MGLTSPTAWVRIRRKETGAQQPTGPAWIYSVVDGAGREHATVPVERVTWPPACDQCARVIPPAAISGARSFTVTRSPSPTTLYLCLQCVNQLCETSRIPVPDAGA